MNAVETAKKAGLADGLEAELARLFSEKNRSNGTMTDIPATFLEVTVRKS